MKVALIANTDWYLYNFRLSLALELKKRGHDVFLVSPDGQYRGRLQAAGLNWAPISLNRRGINILADLKAVFQLYNLLRLNKIDLAHAFTLKGVICTAAASALAGITPKVHGIDGLGYIFSSNSTKARALRPVVKLALRLSFKGRLSRLIVQNRDDAGLFAESSMIPTDWIRTIRGAGVDCLKFSRGGVRQPGEPLRVLLASRLLVDKGVLEFVDASRLLQRQGRNIEFVLAGTPDNGNPGSVSEVEVRQWSKEGLITWLGLVADMPALLATVHVVALPSAYREGLPTCLTEAAACGLPLISTDNPGCREVVTHMVDGLLIPVRDSVALSKAVALLDDDPTLAATLGRAAQRKAWCQFDEKIVIAQTLAVYDELVSSQVWR